MDTFNLPEDALDLYRVLWTRYSEIEAERNRRLGHVKLFLNGALTIAGLDPQEWTWDSNAERFSKIKPATDMDAKQ